MFKLKGSLVIQLLNPEGGIKQEVEVKNLVVNTGLAYIASRMKDATSGVMSHMGLGTGATAAAASDTALQSALGSRVALDSTTIVTTNVSNDTVQFIATFPAGSSTGAITEAGIFSAASAGTMLCRTVFAVVNKGALDSMVITWKVTAS